MALLFFFVFLNFLVSVYSNSSYLVQNSTGLFQNDLLISPISDSIFQIFSLFNSFHLDQRNPKTTISAPLIISDEVSINCILGNIQCLLSFDGNASIEVKSNATFSLKNFRIDVQTRNFFLIKLDAFASFTFNDSALINISPNISYLCYMDPNSSLLIYLFDILNITLCFKDFKFIYSQFASSIILINMNIHGNSLFGMSLINSMESTIKIENMSFLDNKLKTNGIETIFNLGSQRISISSSIIQNNSVDGVLIFVYGNGSSGDFALSSSYIRGNEGFQIPEKLTLIKIIGINTTNLSENLFIEHFSISSVIEITDVQFLLINNTFYSKNAAQNLIFLSNLNTIWFEKSIIDNNKLNLTTLPNYGSSIYILTVQHLIIKDMILNGLFSNRDCPGLFISSKSLTIQKIHVFRSIFMNNEYTSPNFVDSYGGVLSINSLADILINMTLFKANIVNLASEAHGGSCIYVGNLKSRLSIISSLFQENMAEKGGLIMEVKSENISLIGCNFLGNQILTGDLDVPSMIVLKGSASYFTMTNCKVINNLASFGLFYFNEINSPLMIIMDSTNLFYNFGGNAAGMSIGQETNNRTIIWKNSEFKCNCAKGVGTFMFVYLLHRIKSLFITIQNVSLSDNWNPNLNALSVSWCLIFEPIIIYRNCSFINNSFDHIYSKNDIGAIINLAGFSTGYKFIIQDTLFDSNYFYNSWATIFNVQNFITNVIFRNNSCKLTGLFYIYTSYVLAENVLFIENHMSFMDFIKFTYYSSGNFTNLCFVNNSASHTFISAYKSFPISFRNITIINMSLGSEGTLFYLKSTIMELIDNVTISKFDGRMLFFGETSSSNVTLLMISECEFSYLFYFVKKSVVFFNHSTLKGGRESNQMMENMYFKDSKLFANFLSIEGIRRDYFTRFFFYNSSVILLDSLVKTINQASSTNLFFGISSEIIVKNTSFINSNRILKCLKCKIFISNSLFDGFKSNLTTPNYDSFIMAHDSVSFIFEENVLIDIVTNFSVISLSGSSLNQTFYFFNNSFNSTVCNDCTGGCIQISDLYINFSRNIFAKNHAMYAAAIYYSCSQPQLLACQVILQENVFLMNSASFGGGAIKWEVLSPILVNNTFEKNAAKYGNDITSFFCRLGVRIFNRNNLELPIFDSFVQKNSSLFLLKGIKSGSDLPIAMQFFPLDSYNQIIQDKTMTELEISIGNEKLEQIKSLQNFTINDDFYCGKMNNSHIVGDITLIQNPEFYYSISSLQIVACPSSLIPLKISVSGLPRYQNDIYQTITSVNEFLTENAYFLLLPILIDPCQIGEIYDYTKQICGNCPANFYIFEPKSNSCIICPFNAICNGSDQIFLDANYWRENAFSLDIQECDPFIGSCLGGIESSCDDNFAGNLCYSCANKKLTKNNWGQCIECHDVTSNVFKHLGFDIFLTMILFFICLVFWGEKFTEEHRFFLKIIVQYFHFIIVSFSLKIHTLFPPFKNYLWFLHNLTKLEFYISFFCLGLDLNYLVTAGLIMTVAFLISVTIYLLNLCFFDKFRANKSIIIIFFILGPMVFNLLVSGFYCIEIGGLLYLERDPEVDCWSFNHTMWVVFFYSPLLFFFCLLTPFKIFRGMRKSPLLDENIGIFSIYSLGYKEKKNYHDFLLYYRNCVLIISNHLRWDQNSKISIILMVLCYSFAFELTADPYSKEKYSRLVLLLNSTFLFTNYLLMFATSLDIHSSYNFYLIILPIIIILHSNFIFSCFKLLIRRNTQKIFISFAPNSKILLESKFKRLSYPSINKIKIQSLPKASNLDQTQIMTEFEGNK